ncbi:hypothetical protein T4C_11154 [Trichinella pseudospiralis]|uniref:Uncharacterized protein n=1 Tax=Trichinella pseudospiralis TaxID=6337 RepID=A0A0V1K3S4_TRIPS|nr:hypothetical protein T4C_11154 [Trichinella pseudospiralis]
MFSKELTQPSLMTKSYKQKYMNTRRVLLAFKFPCDALPFVCLTIIIRYKRRWIIKTASSEIGFKNVMLDTELKQHSFRMVGYAKGRIYGA